MTSHLTDSATAGGDGSIFYRDGRMIRSIAGDANLGLFVGSDLTPTCPGTTVLSDYDGVNSRMFAAKAAVTNVLSSPGKIDWGLMRYTGDVCAFDNNVYKRGCAVNTDCGSGMVCSGGSCSCNSNSDCTSGTCEVGTGLCTCLTDEHCRRGDVSSFASSSFCINSRCMVDNN